MSLKTTEPKNPGIYTIACILSGLFCIMFTASTFFMASEGRATSEIYGGVGMSVASFVALFVVSRKMMHHI